MKGDVSATTNISGRARVSQRSRIFEVVLDSSQIFRHVVLVKQVFSFESVKTERL